MLRVGVTKGLSCCSRLSIDQVGRLEAGGLAGEGGPCMSAVPQKLPLHCCHARQARTGALCHVMTHCYCLRTHCLAETSMSHAMKNSSFPRLSGPLLMERKVFCGGKTTCALPALPKLPLRALSGLRERSKSLLAMRRISAERLWRGEPRSRLPQGALWPCSADWPSRNDLAACFTSVEESSSSKAGL